MDVYIYPGSQGVWLLNKMEGFGLLKGTGLISISSE
jgi:hypothetical protein